MSGAVVPKSSESADVERNPHQQEPSIERVITVNFLGDGGQAKFYRILGWPTQELCYRSGRRSRVRIWKVRDRGIEALEAVNDGEVQLSIATRVRLLRRTLEGGGMFSLAMPDLRARATSRTAIVLYKVSLGEVGHETSRY
jgi:hypothetical protein